MHRSALCPTAGATDAALLRRDTEDAFAEVVRRHGPVVGRVARSVASAAAADDVVQQTFLSAWLARGRFDPERGSLQTWLCRIAYNRALDSRRTEQRHGRLSPLDSAHDVPCTAEAPVDLVGRRDEAAELRRALQRISAEQRTALTLAYFGGLSQTEIQRSTRAPLGTVKGRLRLGLRALRTELHPAA